MNELTINELIETDGGINWGLVVGGTALVIGAVGLTIATGGIGTVAVGTILGAGTSTELAVSGLACFGGAVGGGAIGHGLTH